MLRHILWTCLVTMLGFSAPGSLAAERERLGWGFLATNDVVGDTYDRWQTGSLAVSVAWGPSWTGHLPEEFGRLIELRFNGQIAAPQNLNRPAAGDRPFAGALGLGLHTHFARGAMDYAVGVDVMFTGPQTGLDDFQETLHEVFGGREISRAVRQNQVSDDVNPSLLFEAGRDIEMGPNASLRPFVEGRWGFETLARVGVDLTVGGRGRDGLLARDPVSGHRYDVVQGSASGVSYVFGADVAYVDDSELLNRDRGLQLSGARTRVRAGLNWQGRGGSSAFYGLTWLSEEFEAQDEGQFVGSVQLRLRF